MSFELVDPAWIMGNKVFMVSEKSILFNMLTFMDVHALQQDASTFSSSYALTSDFWLECWSLLAVESFGGVSGTPPHCR